MRSRDVVLCLCLAGCATASPAAGTVADANDGDVDAPQRADAPEPDVDAPARIDASPSDVDAAPGQPDAAPMIDAAPGTADGLLLSEIELAPSGGEFIEIVNTTSQAIALDHYYLSDNGNYWKLPAGAPTLDADDFIVQFKAGSSIAAHGVVTVSIDTAANFTTADKVAPTYSIADKTVTVVATGSGTPGLTNAGEIVVLFYWDGQSNLVSDVDLMLAGIPAAANGLVSKSGQSVKGPGGTTSTYKTDLNTIAAQSATPASGSSIKRTALETGHETQNGTGNGLTGDDETSEQTGATWDTGSAPTPGTVPAVLLP